MGRVGNYHVPELPPHHSAASGAKAGFSHGISSASWWLSASLFVALGSLIVYHYKWDPPGNSAGSALDHANSFARLLFLTLFTTIVVTIVSAQAGRIPFIRRIPGLKAIDEAVGRATELGRPILFSRG